MDIYAVGTFKKGKDIAGFKMLMVKPDNTTEIMDVDYARAAAAISKQPESFKNLKIEKGKIKGVNGSLDRYGTVGVSQAIVVLKEIHDNNDKFIGYFCSDTNGVTRKLSESDVIKFADMMGIANGKVVNSDNNTRRISSIDGSYDIIKMSPNNKQTQQKQVQSQSENKHGLSNELLQTIAKAKGFSQYNKSFAKKVIDTIEKTGRCSDKQLKIIKDFINKCEKETKTPVTEPVKSETSATETKTDNKDNADKGSAVKKEVPPVVTVSSDDMLEYTIMRDNTAYVKGFKNGCFTEDLLIPDTTIINGKTVAVTGIHINAFNNQGIVNVVTGLNIRDIGQHAFKNCFKLEKVDLSKSKHTHIPMYAFACCPSLIYVNIGNRVERIHEHAFDGCANLVNIDIPDSVETIARNAFEDCKGLRVCNTKAKYINDAAFRGCKNLEEFNFSYVIQIGSNAFRGSGLKDIKLCSQINVIGRKAFADCNMLKTVLIEDGVKEIGEYCFAKSDAKTFLRRYPNEPYSEIEEITVPKSVIAVGNDAFRHSKLVKVYTGSVAESHCIGFNIPYICLDAVNLDNSSKTRVKSGLIGNNPIEMIYNKLNSEKENCSNPISFTINETKLVDIPLSDAQLNSFNIERTTDVIEPHVKFKAAVNYITDMMPLFTDPLTDKVLRMQETFDIKSTEILNDGCNRIYKVSYTIMDSLEKGEYIMVITNNNLRYIADCNMYTDISIENYFGNNDNIPVVNILHAGDTVGNVSTISGNGCILLPRNENNSLNLDRRVNVGALLLDRLTMHGISIHTTKRDSFLYLPAINTVLEMHDGRKYDRPGVLNRETKDCINIIGIYEYDKLIEKLKTSKKNIGGYSKFFSDISKLSDNEVRHRITMIGTIDDEKEAQLFQISKSFRKTVNDLGYDSPTPNMLTLDQFNELSVSYWMISKDSDWLRATGKKSLNKTNEYTIGKYKLFEYKSNQVVKFSNPYMNGKKGAYIFTLTDGRYDERVFASQYNMQTIVNKLYDLTYIPDDIQPVELFKDAEVFDKVNIKLFYPFYDVLYSKNGWAFTNYYSASRASFHIAMYKPNGIFYLVMKKFEAVNEVDPKTKEKIIREVRPIMIPVLPIGNMDRALMVATTTNVNAKELPIYEELIALINSVSLTKYYRAEERIKAENIFNNYIEARKLIKDRCKDVNKYKALINDRAVYMLGTEHIGNLQREHEVYDIDYVDETDDIEDIDMSEFNTDITGDELTDIDVDEDDLDIEIDEDELLSDSEDDEIMSFEDFFETAKSMGVTDETQARAMYAGFLAQQKTTIKIKS